MVIPLASAAESTAFCFSVVTLPSAQATSTRGTSERAAQVSGLMSNATS